jgi:glycosyltransferase involved in cell wall biosynthesis
MKANRVSIVVPVYRSAQSLPELIGRLFKVLAPAYPDFEIILVDDCSPDDSWEVLKSLKAQHGEPLKIVHLLFNRGQHNAILCGFSRVTGDVVVTMDDDLQTPPEEIPKMIEAIEKGFDLAIGAYDSKKHGDFRNMLGYAVDTVQRRIFGLPRDFQLTSFRAASRQVVDQVNHMGGAFPYITCMLFSNAATYTNVPVQHHSRQFGASSYNIRKGLRLLANLLLSYSNYPLYVVGSLCLGAFLFCAAFAGRTLYDLAMHGKSVPGWASTILILTGFSALILFSLLIVLLYIVRINQQLTRTRVNYAIGDMYE